MLDSDEMDDMAESIAQDFVVGALRENTVLHERVVGLIHMASEYGATLSLCDAFDLAVDEVIADFWSELGRADAG